MSPTEPTFVKVLPYLTCLSSFFVEVYNADTRFHVFHTFFKKDFK